MATTEEAEELAAALTVTAIAVANDSIVVVEEEKGLLAVEIDGRVIVASSNVKGSRRRSHMFLLIFNLFHVPAKTRSSPHLLVLLLKLTRPCLLVWQVQQVLSSSVFISWLLQTRGPSDL